MDKALLSNSTDELCNSRGAGSLFKPELMSAIAFSEFSVSYHVKRTAFDEPSIDD